MSTSNKQQWQVTEAEAGARLDKWLAAAERLGSRAKALAALERGKVFVNDVEQTSADAGRRLQAGQTIRLWMDRPGSAAKRYSERHDAGLHLIYEDAALLVINKPAGLLTVPLPAHPDEPSLYDLVKRHLRSQSKREPLIVHRIDRDTSGLVIFAKTGAAQHHLKDQFERRTAERIYLAFVYGHPRPEAGQWRDLLIWDQEGLKQRPAPAHDDRAKEAISRYRVLETFTEAALLEVHLVTGKRNQIRIQAALRKHQLIGEKKYVSESAPLRKIEFSRQALHAQQLKFKHPLNNRPLEFAAPLPDDLQSLLARLQRSRTGVTP
jgi:23S rRNA pseudouridine1911/1915/1917 synthase